MAVSSARRPSRDAVDAASVPCPPSTTAPSFATPNHTPPTSPGDHLPEEIQIKFPTPTRTTASKKSHRHVPGTAVDRDPRPQSQSPQVVRNQALAEFFGETATPPPEHAVTRSRRRRNDSTRGEMFANFSEPDTIAKYLFWYGFGAHTATPFSTCDRLITVIQCFRRFGPLELLFSSCPCVSPRT